MQIDRERLEIWQEAINYIAKAAAEFGYEAGVGGMETAGSLISYLSSHPNDLEPFLNGGFFELPLDWYEQGNLTWHAVKDGKVVTPEYARQRRLINKMKGGVE